MNGSEPEWGRGREREQRIPSRLLTDGTESDVGLEFTNHEMIVT